MCTKARGLVHVRDAGSRLAGQTEVDVTFAAEADRTGVSLTHRGFDRFSALA
jgi:hypothetical protein